MFDNNRTFKQVKFSNICSVFPILIFLSKIKINYIRYSIISWTE